MLIDALLDPGVEASLRPPATICDAFSVVSPPCSWSVILAAIQTLPRIVTIAGWHRLPLRRDDEITRTSTIRESTFANFLSLCDPGRAKTPNLCHPVIPQNNLLMLKSVNSSPQLTVQLQRCLAMSLLPSLRRNQEHSLLNGDSSLMANTIPFVTIVPTNEPSRFQTVNEFAAVRWSWHSLELTHAFVACVPLAVSTPHNVLGRSGHCNFDLLVRLPHS